MHILELIKAANSTIAASDVIEGQISNLLARLQDFENTLVQIAQKETIKSFRNELVFIRDAVKKLF